MITLYAGMFGAVLGAILGYQQLGGPIPATMTDVSQLRQEIGSNTKLILGHASSLSPPPVWPDPIQTEFSPSQQGETGAWGGLET